MDSLLLKTESRLESEVEGSRKQSLHYSFKVKESSPLPPVACLVILDSNRAELKRERLGRLALNSCRNQANNADPFLARNGFLSGAACHEFLHIV